MKWNKKNITFQRLLVYSKMLDSNTKELCMQIHYGVLANSYGKKKKKKMFKESFSRELQQYHCDKWADLKVNNSFKACVKDMPTLKTKTLRNKCLSTKIIM